MADVDPNSIPFIPTTEVKVVDENGKQTTALHDWFQALWGWMKASVVDLTTKVTTLVFQQEELEASIVEEATIRATDDGVIAAHVTTVEATANSAEGKANNATANGQIFLAAKAAPGGAVAAFGTYLTAGGVFTGLEMLAKSDGTSAIGLTASQFTFTDSGTSQQVFGYSGGVFILQVPLILRAGGSGYPSSKIEIYDASDVRRVAIGVGI